MSDVDVAVVGAGVVGAAVAAELGAAGRRTLLLERHRRAGTETSSRSSEVVHAGLYYPPGSLKARACVEGNAEIWRLVREHGLPGRRTGKLVVAAEDRDVARLEELAERGRANGAPDLELIDAREVARVEPRVRCVAALRSPSTGIVDSHALVAHLEARARAAGVDVVLGTRVVGLELDDAGWRLETVASDGAPFALTARVVVNAAGLEADRVAAMAGIDVEDAGYRLHPVRGRYFAMAPARARGISGLVYPLPPREGGGLGVHVTPDLSGRVRLGPDAELVERPAPGEAYDLAVDPRLAERFAAAVRPFLPDVEAAHLSPDQAGIRPALAPPGAPRRDFVLAEESARGLPGLISLVGIESPGLTAAPALARRVERLVRELS